MAKSMFHAQNLDKLFWTKVVVNVVYTRNYHPTRPLDSITSEEVWNRKRPYIAHMLVLRCVPYAMMLDEYKVSSMQRVQNVCFWIIVRGQRPIC